MQQELRTSGCALRTERTYVDWARKYIHHQNKRHPKDMGADENNTCLSHLANDEHVAASTQNQALSTLLFLNREVLHQELGPMGALRAKHPKRLPTTLTKEQTLRPLFMLNSIGSIGIFFPSPAFEQLAYPFRFLFCPSACVC